MKIVFRSWPAASRGGHPPVVLLPATGDTAQEWDGVALALQSSRPVFAVNLRGHGPSDWPGSYSIQSVADDVTGVLDILFNGQSVDVVGHSLGGLIACSVAATRPDRVRRLVLEDIGLLTPRAADPPVRPREVLSFDWQVVEQVRPEIDDFDPRWADVVATISAPTLVIAGGTRSHVPQHQVADLTRRLPDGRMVTVDAGQLVHATKPEAFVQYVVDFLDSSSPCR